MKKDFLDGKKFFDENGILLQIKLHTFKKMQIFPMCNF